MRCSFSISNAPALTAPMHCAAECKAPGGSSHHDELAARLLAHICPGDIDISVGELLMLHFAMRRQPLLPTREKVVEGRRRHLLRKVGIAPQRDHAADRI